MNKLNLIAVFIGVVLFAWWAGQQYAMERCSKNIANINANQQMKIFKITQNVNEKTDNHNTNHIRHVLCQKYSIAE
ncbi:MAG: hypothetical protein IKW57_00855 [Alphaproteobacteria bacterium]|nr:hypothetical protein [Alphaproteobacteria bacterium]